MLSIACILVISLNWLLTALSVPNVFSKRMCNPTQMWTVAGQAAKGTYILEEDFAVRCYWKMWYSEFSSHNESLAYVLSFTVIQGDKAICV